MRCKSLRRVDAQHRPPEMPEIGGGADWKFETRALADGFRHFEVKALASDRPTISIFDYIGDDGAGGGVSAARIAAALRSIGDRPVTVEINSPGGNYFEGVTAYNLLRRHSAEVVVQVLGLAASAASVIAMAGDRIEIAHNASLMIHQAQGVFFGTADDMRAAIVTLEQVDGAMADLYTSRSKLTLPKVAAMMKAETWIPAQDAVDQGFADAIMQREAQPVVYASADAPADMASLDRLLAKQGMARQQRRDLYRTIKGEAPPAAQVDDAGRRALLRALTI